MLRAAGIHALSVIAAVGGGLQIAQAAPATLQSCALATVGERGEESEAPLIQAMHAELEGLNLCALLDREHTDTEVRTARELGLACSTTDVACLTNVASLLKVERLIAAETEHDGALTTLRLVDLDRASGELLGQRENQLDPEAGSLKRQARLAIGLMLAPDRYQGALRISVDRPDALVTVDELAIGRSPLPTAIPGLTRGPHRVQVQLDGFVLHERVAEVRAGVETEVEVVLEPVAAPAPPLAETVAQETTAAPVEPEVSPEEPAPVPSENEPIELVGWVLAASGAVIGLGALAPVGAVSFTPLGDGDIRWPIWEARVLLVAVGGTALAVGVVGIGLALLGGGE